MSATRADRRAACRIRQAAAVRKTRWVPGLHRRGLRERSGRLSGCAPCQRQEDLAGQRRVCRRPAGLLPGRAQRPLTGSTRRISSPCIALWTDRQLGRRSRRRAWPPSLGSGGRDQARRPPRRGPEFGLRGRGRPGSRGPSPSSHAPSRHWRRLEKHSPADLSHTQVLGAEDDFPHSPHPNRPTALGAEAPRHARSRLAPISNALHSQKNGYGWRGAIAEFNAVPAHLLPEACPSSRASLCDWKARLEYRRAKHSIAEESRLARSTSTVDPAPPQLDGRSRFRVSRKSPTQGIGGECAIPRRVSSVTPRFGWPRLEADRKQASYGVWVPPCPRPESGGFDVDVAHADARDLEAGKGGGWPHHRELEAFGQQREERARVGHPDIDVVNSPRNALPGRHGAKAAGTISTFSCDIAYSRSPAASRAVWRSVKSLIAAIFPSRRVTTVQMA